VKILRKGVPVSIPRSQFLSQRSRRLMSLISADSVNYSISSDDMATVQSWDDCVSILLPRNSVPFAGKLVRVAVLCPIDVQDSVDTVLIPRSIRRIYGDVINSRFRPRSMVFELWSELECIDPSDFAGCSLQFLFIPESVDYIGSRAFADCTSITYISFHCHSSLWQLKYETFCTLDNLRAIAIPASIREIHRAAVSDCKSLSWVTFESPSECWYLALEAFSYCPQLQSLFLPASVEVIDSRDSSFSFPHPRYFASDRSHFCVENDCLVRIADQKLILYMGDSPTFCMGAYISTLSNGCFARNGQLQNVVFDSRSRVSRLPAFAFSHCPHLRSITVPKNVLVIGEKCFWGCLKLTTVSFGFPAMIRRIDSCAFYECYDLTSFTVPSSVSTLGPAVFSRCLGLSSVTFESPSQITNIPHRLFYDCFSLTSLCLPDSVVTIDCSAFHNTGIPRLAARGFRMDDSLFMHEGEVLCCLGSPMSLCIPSYVREIGISTFAHVTSLMYLDFQEGVERIRCSAFCRCCWLEQISFPASLVAIEAGAFSDCGRLCAVSFAADSKLQSRLPAALSKAFAFLRVSLKYLPLLSLLKSGRLCNRLFCRAAVCYAPQIQ
jgi:hypothetical protein